MGGYGIVGDVDDFTEFLDDLLGLNIMVVRGTEDTFFDAMCDQVTIRDGPLHSIVMFGQIRLQLRRITWNIWIWLVSRLLSQNGASQATRTCMNYEEGSDRVATNDL